MDDIFNGNDQSPDTSVTIDQLVGEGKKYKDNDALAKSRVEADRYIEQLKSELADMRNDLTARVKLEEVLDRLTSRSSEENNNGYNQNPDDSSRQPAFSETELNRLIETKITQKERDRTVSQNRNEALERLKQHFGSDYVKHLKERASQLKLSEAHLNDLAGTSPTAFMLLVAPQASTPNDRPFTPPRSSVNPDNFASGNPAPGSWAFYEKMRKEKPSEYWTPRVQNQLHKDMIKNGGIA